MFCYRQQFDIARHTVHCVNELLHRWHVAIFRHPYRELYGWTAEPVSSSGHLLR